MTQVHHLSSSSPQLPSLPTNDASLELHSFSGSVRRTVILVRSDAQSRDRSTSRWSPCLVRSDEGLRLAGDAVFVAIELGVGGVCRIPSPERGATGGADRIAVVERRPVGARLRRSCPGPGVACGSGSATACAPRAAAASPRAAAQDASHRAALGGRDPCPVAVLDPDLPRDVSGSGTPCSAVARWRRRRRPSGGWPTRRRRAGSAGRWRTPSRRARVQRCAPFGHASPSATTWSMSTSDAPPRSNLTARRGVWVREQAAVDLARASRLARLVTQVAHEDPLAHVAAVDARPSRCRTAHAHNRLIGARPFTASVRERRQGGPLAGGPRRGAGVDAGAAVAVAASVGRGSPAGTHPLRTTRPSTTTNVDCIHALRVRYHRHVRVTAA